jgi:hypothetical protein
MEQKDWSLIFIYNQLPSNSNIADIEKLYSKLKNEISIAAFFNRRFNSKVPITFPYHSSDKLKLAYKKKQSIIEDNFYVILKKNRINYIKKGFDLFELSFLLQKRLHPDSGYKDYTLSIDRLKQKVIKEINRGNLDLLQLNSGDVAKVSNMITEGKVSKIYFFHAQCSSCQLKTILSNIKLKQVFETGKNIIIFSVMANSYELEPIIRESNLTLPVYLDSTDKFNLFSTITDDRQNPVIIDIQDLKTGTGNEVTQ